MPRDIRTRWNLTFDTLKFTYTCWEAINKLTDNCSLPLGWCRIRDEEWELVKQLRDVLKTFKTVTLQFSTDTPCLAAVIPAMDKMHNELTAVSENVKYSPAVQATLTIGKNLLNKYYSLTDDSEVYRIAMVLHPRYKLKYLEKQGWDCEWIETVETIVREEFKASYADDIIRKPLVSGQASKKKPPR
ncbi:ribonuclease H-like domain-containing protein [Russula dissimulans]|nr:ribonuclease H-like domain-containing protein [Russula dissimulans]